MTRQRQTIELTGDGFALNACHGACGCAQRALDAPDLPQALARALEDLGLGERLRARVGERLRAHHTVKIAISYCPNACARSQIMDVGLIAATLPAVASDSCIACGACAEACREDAVNLDADGRIAAIAPERCVGCAACIRACPSEALTPGPSGFRLMLGGKLGRHPRFAEELPGLFAPEDLLRLVVLALERFLAEAESHERLGDVVARLGAAALVPSNLPPEDRG